MSSIFDTVSSVALQLNSAGIDFIVGGSLASSAWGLERATHDADLAAQINSTQLDELVAAFQWPLVFQSESLRQAIESPEGFTCGQILNGETLDKVDLFLLPHDEYSASQLSRKRLIEVIPGLTLPFASPEDTVITKLRWFELGNRVSDKQWNDIVGVLEMQLGELDESYLDHWTTHFGLKDLLDSARSKVTLP